MNLWSSESQSTFWLHPSHQLPMRNAVVALLTLGVVLAKALPPLPEARGIASYLLLHTLYDPNAVDACVRLFKKRILNDDV